MLNKAPSILIVEDEALIAKEIEITLRRLGYRIAGNTRNGDEALDLLVTRKPDIALLDIHIKGTRNGIDIARHIREKHDIPFVFLTAFSDRGTLTEVSQTLPYGYIVKPFNERDLLSTIELALHKYSTEQSNGFPSHEKLNKRLNPGLTQREYQVLCHLDEGLTYQQVSDEMDVSINTVKTYQKALFAKMGVNSRLACLRLARQLALILLLLLAGGRLYATEITNPELDRMVESFRKARRGTDTTLMASRLDSMYIIAAEDGSDLSLGVYHFFAGKMEMRRGDYEAARQSCQRAIDHLKNTEAYIFLSSAYNDMARYVSAKGNYPSVFEYARLSYEAAAKAGEDGEYMKGHALNSMALAKRRMDDPEAAITYFRQALPFLDPMSKFSPVMNIASAYKQLNKRDSALYYYQESIALARKSGKRGERNLATAMVNLAALYQVMNNHEKALPLAKEAVDIFASKGNPTQRLVAEGTLANSYRKLNMFEEALYHFYNSQRIAKKTKHLEYDTNITKNLLDTHTELAKNDSIIHYLDRYLILNDSLNAQRRDEVMAEMEARFEVDQKEEEITRLELEEQLSNTRLRRQQWVIGLSLLSMGILGGFLWFVMRQRKRIANQNEVIATSLAEKETLLKEIHHRVKNNLQMVSTLLSLQSNYIDDPSALNALQMGRSRVRSMAIIHQGLYMQDSVTPTIAADDYLNRLTGELLATYTDPHKRITLTTDFEPVQMDIDQLIPLGLIANELVTNAMKYAFEGRDEGKLTVGLKQASSDTLVLRVADDGPGSNQITTSEGESFGSLLVQTLTEQLNGRLEVKSDNGTDVRVIFSLIDHPNG